MDPAILAQQNSYDVIQIKNIDTEDFYFSYNKQNFHIESGGVRSFPRFLAEHAVKHLIDQVLNHRNIRTSNDSERMKCAEEVIINELKTNPTPVKTPDQQLKEEVDRLNGPSELSRLLAKQEPPKEQVATTPNEVLTDPLTGMTVDAKDDGLLAEDDDLAVMPPQMANATPLNVEAGDTSTPNTMVNMPTRQALMDYARNTLKMNFEGEQGVKHMQTLDNMSVSELAKTLDYQID